MSDFQELVLRLHWISCCHVSEEARKLLFQVLTSQYMALVFPKYRWKAMICGDRKSPVIEEINASEYAEIAENESGDMVIRFLPIPVSEGLL